MKKLIINADDFGLSKGVNQGILSGFRDGIVTSATMLANMNYFDHAVQIAKENPDMPIGVHLNLSWGKALTSSTSVSSLVSPSGYFLKNSAVFAGRYFSGQISIPEVCLEFRNQVSRVLDAGINPTHLDTHKHFHCLPGIMKALINTAIEFKIDKIRLPLEKNIIHIKNHKLFSIPKISWKTCFIRLFCTNHQKLLQNSGIRTTDYFTGITHMNCLDVRVIKKILLNLKDGVTEFMCHPGYMDNDLRKISKIPPYRDIELKALCAAELKECINALNIQLISYSEL
ncbi:MAG: ChbG/HpnK family deacetylase [Desulfobacteraceae bacterium]|nr:ChbG/HpnK family deacetylase [Desulfobacteraceae bacterium]